MTKLMREMVSHEAGKVFEANDWDRLDRSLIIGSDAGTYYVNAKELLPQNLKVVVRCLKEDAERTIVRAAEVSVNNIAPKNDPALMALAMASFSQREEVRRMAWTAAVASGRQSAARIGTHLFHFLAYRRAVAGRWTTSRMARTALQEWYAAHSAESLAYEVTKYQSRDGVSHRDVLVMSHPKPKDEAHNAIFDYVVKSKMGQIPYPDNAPKWANYLNAVESAKKARSSGEIIELIREYQLPREVIPTKFLNEDEVWAALSEHMPLGAMIRNLGKLTEVGLFNTQGWVDHAVDRLTNQEAMRQARIHPMAVLRAATIYGSGSGEKSRKSWTPNPAIEQALDTAFQLAFTNVKPIGKKLAVAVDTSSSMKARTSMGLTARQVGAAMALIHASVEENVHLMGFSGNLTPLPISKGMSLADVTDRVLATDTLTTYCRLPVEYALKEQMPFDAFVLYTDSETRDGSWQSPRFIMDGKKTATFTDTLTAYREQVAPAKVVVVATAANDIQLTHPDDTLSLNVAGMGDDVPQVISAFVGGTTSADSHQGEAGG